MRNRRRRPAFDFSGPKRIISGGAIDSVRYVIYIDLGVNVSYTDIDNVAVLVEVGHAIADAGRRKTVCFLK